MAGELAIVLSGGGAKGAFQVGVLDELITNRGVKVDIAVGTSTGSIQALAVAQDDIPKLLDLWLGITKNSDIYVKKPLGVVGGIIGADSIYDAKGLRKLLKLNANDAKLQSTGKKLRLGVVNLGTGEFRSIDERVPGIHNWVYASCAMPVFFDPLKTSDGAQWVGWGSSRRDPARDRARAQSPRRDRCPGGCKGSARHAQILRQSDRDRPSGGRHSAEGSFSKRPCQRSLDQ